MWKELYDALKQVLILADTLKRQEEDIKELKKFILDVHRALQRMSDRIDMNDARLKSDLDASARDTKHEIEKLTLKMQLMAQEASLKGSLIRSDGNSPDGSPPARKLSP